MIFASPMIVANNANLNLFYTNPVVLLSVLMVILNSKGSASNVRTDALYATNKNVYNVKLYYSMAIVLLNALKKLFNKIILVLFANEIALNATKQNAFNVRSDFTEQNVRNALMDVKIVI